MAFRKHGQINVPPGTIVDDSEKRTADFLAMSLDVNISFITPSRIKGQKTADIKMHGVEWEIKAPRKFSSKSIENIIRRGSKQSSRIILDLRRIASRTPSGSMLAEIKNQFVFNKTVKHILVITRDRKIVDFKR